MLERLRRYWPFLVLALLPLFPLWRAVFLGQTIGPWDHIRHMAPWNEAAPDKGWDVLQADSCLQFYVWRDMVFHAWGSGHLPIWNHYELGGSPLLANSQSGAFYPLHILVGVLHIPTSLGITLLAWFHLAWAGIGTFLLIKRLGGNDIGALIGGGGCFALSGFLVAWTPLASVTTTIAWIPWCLWAAYGINRIDDLRTHLTSPALILCSGMLLLAGHLQFAAYGILATVIVILIRAPRVGWQATLIALPMLFCGYALAYPQISQVLDNSKHSHRQNTPTWEGFQAYNAGAIQPFELLSLPDPTLLGLPSETVHLSNQPFTGYWPAFVQRGASYAETAIGLGPLVLAALILGFSLIPLRKAAGIATVGIVGFLLALGTIVGAILFFGFPGWSATASPGRASVLFVLAGAVLAGTMFNQAEQPEPDKKSIRRLLIFAAVLLFAAAGVSQFPLQSWLPQLPQDALAATRPSTLTLLLRVALGLGTAALVWLALRKESDKTTEPNPRQILATIGALVLFAVPSVFLIPTGDSNLPPITTDASRVAIVNGSWDLLQAGTATLPPNLASLNHIHELSGYDSLINKDVRDHLQDINNGQDPAPPANGNMMFVKSTADPKKLADAGVTEVWSRKPLPNYPPVSPDASGLYRYPLQSPGIASINGQPVKPTQEFTDSMTYQVNGPGNLVLKENIDPLAWKATLDGKEVKPVAGESMGVELSNIPPGSHTIQFSYSRIGPAHLLIVCVVLYVVLYQWFRRRREIGVALK